MLRLKRAALTLITVAHGLAGEGSEQCTSCVDYAYSSLNWLLEENSKTASCLNPDALSLHNLDFL